MEVVDVGQLDAHARLHVLLAQLVSEALLTGIVIKGANVHLVTAGSVALDSLVFLRVVEPLDSGVTLATLDALVAVVPAKAILERLAVFGGVLDQVGRASEVARVVRKNATLRIMTVFLCWTPTRFVEEHEEDVAFLPCVNVHEWLVEVAELKEALRHEVVFDTLVLKVSVHGLDELEIGKCEANQLVRCLVLVEGHDKGPVEPIVTEELQFLSVVVSSECLL